MIVGLVLGIVIGLLLGPLVRSWLAWREYVDASREARLTDDVIRFMSEPVDQDKAGAQRASRTG